ncbi:hypothetical protein B0J14DRAFT_494267 [Halenospora varia]|nr:hypothetical protein B0J14DRAFT_494267 [Halenospora varia]
MAQQNNRNSPHLSSHASLLHQNGSAPASPSMSSSNQNVGQSRQQPVNYPSPTSYPSPSLSNNQYNYPPPNHQVSEPYRASPTGSNGSLSLPSMRTLDSSQQNQQHHQMASGLPPVAPMGGPYYQTLPHPSQQYPNVTSDPTGQNMRYALPVGDSRVMSGGRHKKEIKRRTKTGCLTCRKRRIKCDEAHPACRNCQKSKRECLGYDPIFKQQPGPAAIQPAPSSAPSQAGSTATAQNPYGAPPMLSGGYVAGPNMSYEASLSTGVSSPGSASQQFDYTSAIDPALEAAAPPAAGHYTTPAKRTVNELLALGGVAPPPSNGITQIPNALDETKHLFYSIYAPGIENFLETKWYSAKGLDKLLGDRSLMDQFATLLTQFAKTATQNDPKELAYTSSVEARIVWALNNMVRTAATEAPPRQESKSVPSADDPVEAGNRLTVFENLLTGRVTTYNPLTRPIPGSTDHHRLRELEFWHTLGQFVSIKEEDPNSTKDIDNCMSALRNLLDGRENRDVLYSIVVIRAIGPRVTEYAEGEQPLQLDESDNRSKLLVAKKFIMDEASGAGTTNVIRRLCELAARSWVPTGQATAPSSK